MFSHPQIVGWRLVEHEDAASVESRPMRSAAPAARVLAANRIAIVATTIAEERTGLSRPLILGPSPPPTIDLCKGFMIERGCGAPTDTHLDHYLPISSVGSRPSIKRKTGLPFSGTLIEPD